MTQNLFVTERNETDNDFLLHQFISGNKKKKKKLKRTQKMKP